MVIRDDFDPNDRYVRGEIDLMAFHVGINVWRWEVVVVHKHGVEDFLAGWRDSDSGWDNRNDVIGAVGVERRR